MLSLSRSCCRIPNAASFRLSCRHRCANAAAAYAARVAAMPILYFFHRSASARSYHYRIARDSLTDEQKKAFPSVSIELGRIEGRDTSSPLSYRRKAFHQLFKRYRLMTLRAYAASLPHWCSVISAYSQLLYLYHGMQPLPFIS